MMVPLRIRKALVALADGRLDEAYQQAIREDVRDHRKGQRLITRLTKAYQRRAQSHLGAGNHAAALTDADRAIRLGGNQPGIVALRERARSEFDASRNAEHGRRQKIAAARKCLAAGDFSLGERICEDVDSSKTVVSLMHDAELNRRQVQAALDRGRKSLRSSQWEQAIDAIDEAQRLQPAGAEVVELRTQVTQGVTREIRQLIVKGKLGTAEMLLSRIRLHAAESIDVQELSRFVSQCREAIQATQSTDISEVATTLKSLKSIVPEARWLDSAIKEAETVVRSVENLRVGPLGSVSRAPHSTAQKTSESRFTRSKSPMRVFEATPVIPDNFMIHLDGTGSVLVARGPSVMIGSPSRSRKVDVALKGQHGLPSITIERIDEDYFLSSEEQIPINGKPVSNTLLSTHDQVRLGRRGSMQFALPNAASTSATLDFTGVRLAGGNARRVILMDDAIIIGPQPSAHIQSLAMERAMVLHWRNGEMRLRPMSRSMETDGTPLVLDCPHDVDGLSLVVTQVSEVV